MINLIRTDRMILQYRYEKILERMRTMEKYRFETRQVHSGQEQPDSATDARAVPIYATTSYVFENAAQAAGRFALTEEGNIYSRLMNPTNDIFEKRIADLEGGAAALAVSSGMAAISYAVQNIVQSGDHIVCSKSVYGGTYNLFANTLKNFGIEVSFVEINDFSALQDAIRKKTKALFCETLGNPNSDIADIDGIAKVAHSNGLPLIVDNTFATPYFVRPLEHGADIVVHSATKFIGGHGTVLGGVIIDGGKFNWAQSNKFPTLTQPNPAYHGVIFSEAGGKLAYLLKIRTVLLRDTGAALSPFHSFAFLQGLETLSLRMERHVENALRIVQYLNEHPKVKQVHHPSLANGQQKTLYERYFPQGGGSIFTFELLGTEEEAKRFSESLELFSLLANVADVKSLVIHPASTTHAQMTEEELLDAGIYPTTVRLSVGTEHIDDLLEDLEQGFKKTFG